MSFEERVEEIYLDIPEAFETQGFVPVSRSGKILFLSGVLPYAEARLAYKGRVGLELSVDKGNKAAKAAAVQALAVLRKELGSLDKIKNIISFRLYVATGAEFKEHYKVLAGALDLYSEIFGEHAKCAVEISGCASLPEGAAVELALTVEVK